MAGDAPVPVTAKVPALVFLEDSWKLRQTRANAAETIVVFAVDVNPTTNGTYGDPTADTVKIVANP